MAAPDRRELLAKQTALTGIDFVGVDATDQTKLNVHFLVPPSALTPGATPFLVDASKVTIRSRQPDADVAVVAVLSAALAGDVLLVTVQAPVGFAPYLLHLESDYIDPFFNDASFSFKVNCPSRLDCEPSPVVCAPDPRVDFPVDYLARDFWSLRRALLDFASLRYPEWSDAIEADLGVMLAEAMSSLGDEHAYFQDRVAREAYLETATQRRSLRRHARLVDYDIHDGLAATTWIEVTVKAGFGLQALLPGTQVRAVADDTTFVVFEVGTGLADTSASYLVSDAWNAWAPHPWSDAQTCLEVGTTSVDVEGDRTAAFAHRAGVPLLLRTDPPTPGKPQRRIVVTVLEVALVRDPLLGQDVTRIRFAEPLPFEMDLDVLTVHANIVPATAGATLSAIEFTIPASAAIEPGVVERTGPNGTVAFLYSLAGTDDLPLVWLGADPRRASPEVRLVAKSTGEAWLFRSSFVGSPSAAPDESVFTLDDGMWRTIVHYDRPFERIDHFDYASDRGKTVRFGDGRLGRTPPRSTTFTLAYRVGGGAASNVPADSITVIDAAAAPFVAAVTNPLAALGGVDPESPAAFKQLAPEAFRAVAYRAVTPPDYAEAVERLPWVQRAGAAFRWTGSWVTAFATPDPHDAVVLAEAQRADAERQLDAFRQAGRDAVVRDPKYADLDLEIAVCVEPSSYRAHVQAAVMKALVGESAYFSPERFTFGTPLERASLEAAIQAVHGVRAVERVRMRRRGWFDWADMRDFTYSPGIDTVIRVEQDSLHPERGTIQLCMEGGA